MTVDESTLPKYAVVDCVVAGHQDFGLAVESEAGWRGFVDRADIADDPVRVDDWPVVGDRLRGVVLGHTRDGRLRLSARERDLMFVESVTDPGDALREWQEVNADDAAVECFYRSANARPLLRWALSHSSHSVERERAHRLLLAAPTDLRADILGTTTD